MKPATTPIPEAFARILPILERVEDLTIRRTYEHVLSQVAGQIESDLPLEELNRRVEENFPDAGLLHKTVAWCNQ